MDVSRPKKKNFKFRSWCFTYNNPTEEGIERLMEMFDRDYDDGRLLYAIIGNETAPETGTPHIQGFCKYKNEKTWKFLKKIDEKIHIEPARSSDHKNFKYCSKEGDFQEFGERPKKQGNRTDIDEIRLHVLGGGDMRTSWMQARGYQALKFAEMGIKLFGEKRSWKPMVVWFHGSTGTGKSQTAEAIFHGLKMPFWKMGADVGSFPFEGYEGEPGMWLDDFRASDMTFHCLLQVLDRYECRLQVKGGSRQCLAKLIIITCPTAPKDTYKLADERVDQLLRRITYISGPGSRQEILEQILEHGAEVASNTNMATSIENNNNSDSEDESC